jgi:hypothetical protein
MRYLQFGATMYDTARATPGFTLIVPYFRHEASLIGMRGEVLHQWTNLPLLPGTYSDMLNNGNLLWAGRPGPASGISHIAHRRSGAARTSGLAESVTAASRVR